MKVSIAIRVRRPAIAARRLRGVVMHALRRERCQAGTEVSVALVSDAAIRRLSRRFLGIDKPTDVLAFPLRGEVVGDHMLGEVIVSVDRARLQARKIGHSPRSEVALLAVHGVLHLLGYDDTTPVAAARMARRQRTLVAEAGEEVRG